MAKEIKTSAPRRLNRAVVAIPFLILVAIMIRAFTFAPIITPVFDKIYETGIFDRYGVRVPIIKEFYRIKWLDFALGQICIGFGQMQFFVDPTLYWHSLVFITDYTAMYAVFLFEASRENSSGLFRYPAIFTLLAQFISLGIVGNLWFFSYVLYRPVSIDGTIRLQRINKKWAAAILPTIIIGYYSSHFPSYFHQDLEVRHWWTWIWQLYPIWCSITWMILSSTVTSVFVSDESTNLDGYLPILKKTAIPIVATSASIWWYTLFTSGFQPYDLFMPRYLLSAPPDADLALLTIIQYDYLLSFTGALLWLAYEFKQLKDLSLCCYSWSSIVLIAFAIFPTLGLGPLFIIGWLAREQCLVEARNAKSKHT